MRDNISIIFAALIGVFLVVLLPLFSLLDRQDSMAYNVVLTATTNFVDKIRTNGFIDNESYNNYIAAMASTGNTYKVKIKAYKKILINEIDDQGNVIKDAFIEEKELYNTKDILEQLDLSINKPVSGSTYKNNVYLFNKDDEIYVSVENTNLTTGSIIYSLLADVSNQKVVDINYGGVINNINWELYEKVKNDAVAAPEVVMSVPVNANGSTNVTKVDSTGTTEYIDCTLANLDEAIGDTDLRELCEDLVLQEGQNYTYLYDLSNEANKQIRVAVELRGIDKIDVGTTDNNTDSYKKISELTQETFNDVNGKSRIEEYIISNYIKAYGMYSPDIDIDLRQNNEYYVFDIYFNDVVMGSIDYISTKATINILPGLGQDENGILSSGAESVEIELYDEDAVNTVKISAPHIWEKLLKTKSRSESVISTNTVYANEDIAFVVSYTGIVGHTDEAIKQALIQHLEIYSNAEQYEGLEIYTAEEFNQKYKIDLTTVTAGHIIIKFRYTEPNNTNRNYVRILDNWIATNLNADELGYEVREYAMGVVSSHYEVLEDTSGPLAPTVVLSGTVGTNNWYTSNVVLTVIPSSNDTIKEGSEIKVGGSGVARNTLSLTGETILSEQEIDKYEIKANGKTEASVKAYDYVGNSSTIETTTINIDQEEPTAPIINVISGTQGNNGWYTDNVKIEIIPGRDSISGVDYTTYEILGANAVKDPISMVYTLENDGISKVVATTYDKAGNKKSSEELEIKIDKSEPLEANVSVIKGEKRLGTDWYHTDVKLKVRVSAGEAISGFGGAKYKIVGTNEVALTDIVGNETEIHLTQNGTHSMIIYTYTAAGKSVTTTYTVQIDKDAPKKPIIKVNSGNQGNNNWYTSAVEVQVMPQGDNGPSLESQIRYTITKDGTTSNEQDITSGSRTIKFNEQGEYTLKVYSRDTAFNEVSNEQVIKIDWTAPTSAEFNINGTPGENGWYKSDVNISYTGGADNLSGIDTITLSEMKITQDTNGKQVTLTTKDKAGNTVTDTRTIQIDTQAPKAPTVEILTEQTGNGPIGVKYYNKDVQVKLTPGKDYLIDGVDNTEKTTYTIEGSNISESAEITEEQIVTISDEGLITITITTLDKAGNSSSATQNLWINKEKPEQPSIVSINGEQVTGTTTKEIYSNLSEIELVVDNLIQGNKLTITLINQDTNTEVVVSAETETIRINLKDKGKYSIVATQTNMFGTTSEISSGLYYYIYE